VCSILFSCVITGVSSQCATNCTDPLLPVCDESSNTCVACITNLDCEYLFVKEIFDDSFRNHFYDKQFCVNGSSGPQCVECLSAGDCRNSTYCNSTCSTGLCSFGSLQCASSCNATLGKCACNSNADCTLNPKLPVCWTDQSLCVECNTDSDCKSSTKGNICQLDTHKCIQCLENTQCQVNNSNCGST
jgi:hypothetical protein